MDRWSIIEQASTRSILWSRSIENSGASAIQSTTLLTNMCNVVFARSLVAGARSNYFTDTPKIQ